MGHPERPPEPGGNDRIERGLESPEGRPSIVHVAASRSRGVARVGRRVVRRIVSLPRRTARSIRGRGREWFRVRALRATPAAELALIEALARALPSPTLEGGPLVSIVILNRDGRDHLERCLGAVATTAYRDIEIIVVDNGSTDGSPEFAEGYEMPFPLTVIRNAENRTFSDANRQGVDVANGSLICFLNNDVDPITEGWLGYMVESMTTTGAVAVGARLIYPRHRGGRRAGTYFADLTVQHAGVEFDRTAAIPMPLVIGAGEDPLAPTAAAVEERPALTGACLLVDRYAFEDVGGFNGDYDYGIEDVDLCLKLRAAGGRLVYDGRAALWHHESATRAADRARYRGRVTSNREIYVDHWGPRIFRETLLDAVTGSGRFSRAPFHVAITVTDNDPAAGYGDWYTGHELGDALEELGWRVTYIERKGGGWYAPDDSVEAIIVLLDACDTRRLPRNLVTMAWIRNWPERWLERPWFDEYDLVFGSSDRIVDLVRERSAKVASLLPIATNPDRFGAAGTSPDLVCDVLFVGSYWGQHRGVVDALPALAAAGYSVHVHGRGWDAVPAFAGLDRGFLAYDDVPRAYASARIVVDDAATSTKPYGSVNSRVFDATAAGAIVVSDGALGVQELFDDAFPTWSDGPSLVRLVESILGEPGPATERALSYRRRVIDEHAYGLRAATIRDSLIGWASATRYGVRIGVPNWDVTERWGDYHFARGLQRSLERAGHPTRLHFLPDWDAPVGSREDVTVHLFGLKEAPTRPSQVNLMWQISHPDLATATIYDRYDHVFVASDPFAARMAAVSSVPVTPLHQATDPERFWPDPSGPRHDLLFVANSRKVRRRIVADLAGTDRDFAVYGRGWKPALIDPRFVKGEGIPNAEVRRYYSSASIVLNDHWDDMRAEGFISNRLYDALACAAFVVSDQVDGIDAEFDGAVATYRDRADLEAIIDWALADPAERRRRGEAGRRVVVARHTFEARARILEAAADAILVNRPSRIIATGDQAPRSIAASSSAKGN